MLECRLGKISSSAQETDSFLHAWIKYGDKAYPAGSVRTDASATPQVLSINPLEVSSVGETLTIKGSVLNELKIEIGGKECSVIQNIGKVCTLYTN